MFLPRLAQHLTRLNIKAYKSLRLICSSTPCSQPISDRDKKLYDDLLQQTEVYKKELRKLVYGHPKARLLNRNLANLQKRLAAVDQRIEEVDWMALRPTVVSLEVLSNGTTQMLPSVVVRTQLESYIFNVPEGTSRFISQVHISPNKIHDMFITRGVWDCMGGIGGLLMTKNAQDKQTVRLHGPRNLREYLTTIRPFMDSDYGNAQFPCSVEERTFEALKFEDDSLTIHYIPVFLMSEMALDKGSVGLSNQHVHTAYWVEMKKRERSINPLKLIELKVPKGPMIGQLKSGKSVTLSDGTVVRPEDVYSDKETPDFATNLLIVDCDHIDRLKSLEANQNLMKISIPNLGKNMLRPNSYERFPVRGNATSQDTCFQVRGGELMERENRGGSVIEAVEKFKQGKLSETVDLTESISKYPSLAFLGTSSACPTKYRNVSAYLLRLSETSNILVDVGEGTFGQIRTLFGPEEANEILANLNAIFITHGHLDHINGLFTIVEKRVQAFEKLGKPYRNLIIVCNQVVRRPFNLYCQNFVSLEKLVKWIDTTVLSRPLTPERVLRFSQQHITNVFWHSVPRATTSFGKERQLPKFERPLRLPDKTWIETISTFPGHLFDPTEWNLKSAKAVFVHHTRMASGFVFDTMDGKRIVFSGDTMPCANLAEHGKGADLLVHEATFEDSFERDARRKRHSTTGQAIQIAEKMQARHLILSHFSARYPRCTVLSPRLLQHGHTSLATDFMVAHWNKLALIDRLPQVYASIFEMELKDLEVKDFQRLLKVAEKEKKDKQDSVASPKRQSPTGNEAPELKKVKAVE